MAASEEEWIKHRAYQLWEQEGYPSGKDTEHWERAKLEYISLKPIASTEKGLPSGSKPPKAKATKPAAASAPSKAAPAKASAPKAASPAKAAKPKTDKPKNSAAAASATPVQTKKRPKKAAAE